MSEDMKAHLMWTQSTSTYYKLGNLPWKLHGVRDEVLYLKHCRITSSEEDMLVVQLKCFLILAMVWFSGATSGHGEAKMRKHIIWTQALRKS